MKHLHVMLVAAALCAATTSRADTDMTSSLQNPDFESGWAAWAHYGLQTQTNTAFGLKSGTTYMERWSARGTSVGSAHVSQVLTSLPVGVYVLSAVAQNIQENTPAAAQTGAYLIAGTERTLITTAATYEVRFTVTSASAQTVVGLMASGATGNYLAFDNFRLTQVATGLTAAKAELKAVLQEAVAASQAAVQSGSATGRDDYAAAIEAAEAVAASDNATAATLQKALAALRHADTVYAYAAGSGSKPVVTTGQRYTRGADVAFCRATFTGSNIVERGFCWSSATAEPTVADERSTVTLSYNGDVYVLPALQPSTAYYVRPYAITSTRAVAYGQALKIVTIPRGTITFWYDNGADADANTRISNALTDAVAYWNRLTSISGFAVSCSYGSGTPTADCSYGGSMRVGPNASYQRTGTIMHEMLHGIGVGTCSLWWNGEMRSNGDRGDWLGTRATEVIRFWDDSDTEVLTGDNTHLWPYGINGTHEDTGSNVLYIITSLIAQALGEDGLPPYSGAFATPAYVLQQDDAVKCYIKTEDEALGGLTSYLCEGTALSLQQRVMDSETAQATDAAAWYVLFDPATRTYRFRNAQTGHYLAYNTSTATFRASALASGVQLMRGRSLISVGSEQVGSYHILRPSAGTSPAALTATSPTTVGAAYYDLAAAASQQRWLVVTAAQTAAFDEAYRKAALSDLQAMTAFARTLLAVPHTQLFPVDATLNAALADAETAAATAGGAAIEELTAAVRTEVMDYLSYVRACDGYSFDLTPLLVSPAFDTGTSGWEGTVPALGAGCAEFYEKTFDIYQQLPDMPAGDYALCVQAFQRPGTAADSYAAFAGGTPGVSAQLYIGSTSAPIAHIARDRQATALYTTDDWSGDVQCADGTYVPNSMTGSAAYFANSLYANTLTATTTERGTLRLGLRSAATGSFYWTIFDNFSLLYYGANTSVRADALQAVAPEAQPAAVTLSGVRLATRQPQRPGIYIVAGRKVAVR